MTTQNILLLLCCVGQGTGRTSKKENNTGGFASESKKTHTPPGTIGDHFQDAELNGRAEAKHVWVGNPTCESAKVGREHGIIGAYHAAQTKDMR